MCLGGTFAGQFQERLPILGINLHEPLRHKPQVALDAQSLGRQADTQSRSVMVFVYVTRPNNHWVHSSSSFGILFATASMSIST
jgi:hypothetical protein